MDALLQSARALDGSAPRELLEWTVTNFSKRTVLTVSFGGGGVVLAHMVHVIDPTIPVVFLNTGFHFEETLAFKSQLVQRYGWNVMEVHPLSDPGRLYETDPDRCCAIRKVEPMQRMLHGYDAWISALRRDQSVTRQQLDVAEWHDADDGGRILKVYPLLHWSGKDVWRYLYEHGIPHHPLLDQGYRSIGCWPCTRPVRPGEDERAGRWSGTGKTECGLYTFTSQEKKD